MSTYQHESVNKILAELRIDQEHYNRLYKTYKRCHRILLFLEFICHSTNLGCQSSALVSLLTVTAIPVGLAFNGVGIVSSGVGVFCRQLNHRKSLLMMKNKSLLKLSRHTERSIISKCLNDEEFTPEEYNLVLKLIETYYEQKSEVGK